MCDHPVIRTIVRLQTNAAELHAAVVAEVAHGRRKLDRRTLLHLQAKVAREYANCRELMEWLADGTLKLT